MLGAGPDPAAALVLTLRTIRLGRPPPGQEFAGRRACRYGEPIVRLQKVAVVGAGSVGAAVAYASMIDGVAGEIALYDVNAARARAEVLDLRHGLQFVGGGRVNGGDDVAVCADADLIVVTAGAKQDPARPGWHWPRPTWR